MRRTTAVLAAMLALAAAVLIATTSQAGAAPIRIMPLGDSITGSPGCWRALLWNRLQSTGHTDIDFVGTLPPQGCGVSYDGDNEGHGGFLATNVANQNQLPGWLAATRPDIVLMHFGTNDVWSNIAPATILSAFTTLVNQMRASNPNMKILGRQDHPDEPVHLPRLRPTYRELQQRHPQLGRHHLHPAVADHGGGPVDGVQHEHGHL
ncbi:GDSL-type esterase/lipase family protein [Nonomuraea sp. B12E4]|uniref:GDSL-type esterase/lipase family protein n=1 Tax=Nonomuraea sp. B12E4 TaxID=3153564 RepID=UPI00325EEEA4